MAQQALGIQIERLARPAGGDHGGWFADGELELREFRPGSGPEPIPGGADGQPQADRLR